MRSFCLSFSQVRLTGVYHHARLGQLLTSRDWGNSPSGAGRAVLHGHPVVPTHPTAPCGLFPSPSASRPQPHSWASHRAQASMSLCRSAGHRDVPRRQKPWAAVPTRTPRPCRRHKQPTVPAREEAGSAVPILFVIPAICCPRAAHPRQLKQCTGPGTCWEMSAPREGGSRNSN